MLCLTLLYLIGYSDIFSVEYNVARADAQTSAVHTPPPPVLDRVAYDKKTRCNYNFDWFDYFDFAQHGYTHHKKPSADNFIELSASKKNAVAGTSTISKSWRTFAV